jgi:hypothetical protein
VKRPPLLIFDIESVGLHGEGFAFGLVLVENGEVTNEALAWCHPDRAIGDPEGRRWADENVVPELVRATAVWTHPDPRELRSEFWGLWRGAKDKLGAVLMADVPWPVEANWLTACIADDVLARRWEGPHPLLDAGTLRFAGQAKPAEDIHNPLEDARATWLSIRDWWRG